MVRHGIAAAIMAIGVTVLAPSAAMAQMTSSDRETVAAYRSAIRSADSGMADQAIEAAYARIVPLRKALMRVRADRDTVLESLSDAEFARLVHELPGVLINREEAVFVKADVDYFTRLAADHGGDADRAFFAALKATYPDSVWPAYIEQETDYSGCTRFGSMSLVDSYRAWSGFQRRYPGRYAAAVRREIDAVLTALTGSTCACGSLEDVEKELKRFNSSFPASAGRARIDQRLQAIGEHRSGIRAHCIAE